MKTNYAFISHSSLDNAFAIKLVEELKKENEVWIDLWNMDIGDKLPLKIERGIDNAKEFVVILSKNSLKSRWVQYEFNMALIKSIEDMNYRVVVIRIDDCEVPLRFKPFLYIDSPGDEKGAIDKMKKFLEKSYSEKTDLLFRRRFVNRNSEIGKIEEHINDPEIRLICVIGFYGIGKTTVVKEAINRIWQSPVISEISLSSAHIGSRMALDLCTAAGMQLPPDGAKKEDLLKHSFLSIESLLEKRTVVMFNHLESLLDDDGYPEKDLDQILTHISNIPICSKLPIFLLSRRFPKFKAIDPKRVGFLKVDKMQTNYIVSILENEVSRTLKKEFTDRKSIEQVAENLYGYPLAGKLSAPLLAKYSPEYLLKNLKHIEDLRLDIADSILTNLHLKEDEVRVLELLALFNGTITTEILSKALSKSPDDIIASIDILAGFNIIECDGIGIKIHPIIQGYYWKYARQDPKFNEFANTLAIVAKEKLLSCNPRSSDYVFWLTNTCRLLFICGRMDESRKLRRDLIGELKAAAIDLYQKQEYGLSLEYCEEYLEDDPGDFQINFHKARCLSRLDRFDDALKILDSLLAQKDSSLKRMARILYGKGRTYFERYNTEKNKLDLEEAKKLYISAIEKNQELRSAYQSLAEVLSRLDDLPGAEAVLKKALDIAPNDAYALSLYADILWRKGERPKAIETMKAALATQPENADFLFRIGRLMKYNNQLKEAFEFINKAAENKPLYYDARLSRADVALDIHRPEIAKADIQYLKDKLVGKKASILKNIEAGYELAMGRIKEADEIGKELIRKSRDVQNLMLMAKVEFEFYKSNKRDGINTMAEMHKTQAAKYAEEALSKRPGDPYILSIQAKILSA